MAGGFILYDRDDTAFKAVMRQFIAKPSTQFAGGDALVFVNGRLEQAATAANQVDAILNCIVTPASLARPATANLTTTLGEEAQYIPCRGNGLKFKTNLDGDAVPPINGTACNANAVTNIVKVTAAGSTNDYVGGTIFCNGEQRTIVTDVVGAGVHTFTTNKAFTRAITTGDTAIVVPFSRGTRGVKLGAATMYTGISSAVADKSGGKVDIEDVSLNNLAGNQPYAIVSFQY